MGRSDHRVDALTGARALAGVYILSLHFGGPLFRHAPRWAERLRECGYLATSWFIMLSGFVLTIAYGKKLRDGRMKRRGFLIQRLARVYPVYGLALVLMLPFALVHRWGAITAAFGDASVRYKLVTGVAQATFLHVWHPALVTSWNLPGWCVSVEMWFYAFFPALVVWLLGRSRRALLATLAASWAAALAFAVAYTTLAPGALAANIDSSGLALDFYKFSPLVRWPEFVFGMALGALWLAVPDARRGRRHATLFVGGGALAALAIVCGSDRIPYTMLHNGTLLPIYAVLVWGLMLGDGPLHRALSLRPLTALGDASYVLYILQVPLMMWMILVSGRRYGHGGPDAPFTAVALVALLAAAIVLRRAYELRAQPWLRARLERLWPARAADEPAPLPAPVATSPAAAR